jgi:hypothetical protein
MSTANKLFVEELNAAGKRVIVRVDFNVPLKDGKVESDKRLKESLPTIKYLREKGAKVILMSHLGRPDGQRVPEMSLRPVAEALGALLGAPVAFADDCVGAPAEQAVAALAPGGVLLLDSKICASTPPRRKTIPPLPSSWRRWPTSTSMTPSAVPTARTRRRKASPSSCPRRRRAI